MRSLALTLVIPTLSPFLFVLLFVSVMRRPSKTPGALDKTAERSRFLTAASEMIQSRDCQVRYGLLTVRSAPQPCFK